jgi:hypothetical protein
MVIYFLYGVRRSKLAQASISADATADKNVS